MVILRRGLPVAAFLLVTSALSVAPVDVAHAEPVTYTICNAEASVGFHGLQDGNYLERHASGRPLTRVREGNCATFAADYGMYLELVGYRSFRWTTQLDASGTSSSYSSCVDRGNPEISRPSESRKIKGYRFDGCVN